MGVCCDYSNCELTLRQTMLLEEAKAAGLSRTRFLPLLTLMRIESTWTPTQFREKYAPLPADPYVGACPCIAMVGFERSMHGGISWDAWNNEAIRAKLLELQLVGGGCAPGTTCAMQWSQMAMGTLQARWLYILFEEMMLHRWEPLLDYFSLGGTQMHLAWVGSPGYPKNWEEIWDVYTGRRNGWLYELELRDERQGTNLPDYQDQNLEEAWLQRAHTGSSTEAKKYWRGERPQYGQGYGYYLADTRFKAQQLGW